MKSIASKKAGPGGTSSYISHNSTRLYMHCNFGLGPNFEFADNLQTILRKEISQTAVD